MASQVGCPGPKLMTVIGYAVCTLGMADLPRLLLVPYFVIMIKKISFIHGGIIIQFCMIHFKIHVMIQIHSGDLCKEIRIFNIFNYDESLLVYM